MRSLAAWLSGSVLFAVLSALIAAHVARWYGHLDGVKETAMECRKVLDSKK